MYVVVVVCLASAHPAPISTDDFPLTQAGDAAAAVDDVNLYTDKMHLLYTEITYTFTLRPKTNTPR